jgi:hypothetical protein
MVEMRVADGNKGIVERDDQQASSFLITFETTKTN